MDQLSSMDASFLHLETPETPMHVGSLMLFELPEGYVRHYQTTDDGRSLPPILMFHPDVAGVDENGNPVLTPEQRIVPPDLAPPGLPHRMLDETRDVGEPVGRRVHSDPAPPPRRR